MKKKMFILLLLTLSGGGLFTGSNTVQAADMNYSVKANIPENQIDKDKTYFDLKMTPSQKQIISLELENSSDQEMTIQIGVNTATTNRNGVINYGKSKMDTDNSLTYDMSKLIEGDNEVVLLPKEKKVVDYTVTMPEKSFDGILLGGFYIHKKQTKEERESEKNVQIKNDFSYVIGIKLNETDQEIEPELKLNTVTPGLQNYRTVVNATIQNVSPVIISGMAVEAKISKEGSNEILHETKKDNQSMAPNSSYEFPISWENQELKPGNYTLVLTASDKNQHEWKFNKNFKIKGEAKKLNKKAVELEKKSNLYVYITIVLINILLVMLVFWRKSKK